MFRGVHDSKAKMYQDTATSLRLEILTGKWHCVCCLLPRHGKAAA